MLSRHDGLNYRKNLKAGPQRTTHSGHHTTNSRSAGVRNCWQDHPEVDEIEDVAAAEIDDVTALAVELWRAKGCPAESLPQDLLRAAEILRSCCTSQ